MTESLTYLLLLHQKIVPQPIKKTAKTGLWLLILNKLKRINQK